MSDLNNTPDLSDNIMEGVFDDVYSRALNNVLARMTNANSLNFGTANTMLNIPNEYHNMNVTLPNIPLPFFNPSTQNLLFQTLNQKNRYKSVLSAEGERQIKILKFSESMNQKKCPITLDCFTVGEEISQLPCNHIFKKDAITEWLREEQAKCPVCRFELKSTEVKIEPSIVQQQQQQQPSYEEEDTDSDMPPLEDDDEESVESESPMAQDVSRILEILGEMRTNNTDTRLENLFLRNYINRINRVEEDRDLQRIILQSIQETNTSSPLNSTPTIDELSSDED